MCFYLLGVPIKKRLLDNFFLDYLLNLMHMLILRNAKKTKIYGSRIMAYINIIDNWKYNDY